MLRSTLTVFSFISLLFFPWLFTVVLVLVSAFFIPLLPLAVGLSTDALYYAPHAGSIPLFTLYGAVMSALAIFVQKQLRTSIIKR